MHQWFLCYFRRHSPNDRPTLDHSGCIPTNHPGISGNNNTGCIPVLYPGKIPGSAALAHGPDARAFGLPVARIVRAHIVTLHLHELSAAKTATERILHQIITNSIPNTLYVFMCASVPSLLVPVSFCDVLLASGSEPT